MHIWIVEYLLRGKWRPTIGCRIRKPEGKTELRKWKERDPNTQFRLQKYIPAKSTKLPW